MEAPIPRHVAQAYEEEEAVQDMSAVRLGLKRHHGGGGHNGAGKISLGSVGYYVIQPDSAKEELSQDDVARRERRKASNRNAARRCREKKMMEQLTLMQKKEQADRHVSHLNQENQRLQLENQQLRALLQSPCVCKANAVKQIFSSSHTTSSSPSPPRKYETLEEDESLLNRSISPPTPPPSQPSQACWVPPPGPKHEVQSSDLSSTSTPVSTYDTASDSVLDLSQPSSSSSPPPCVLDLSKHKDPS